MRFLKGLLSGVAKRTHEKQKRHTGVLLKKKWGLFSLRGFSPNGRRQRYFGMRV